MPKHSSFFTYQAQIAGTDYIAIPRQVGTEARVEIFPLHNPGIDDVTGAIVAGSGKLIEASKLAVSRTGHEDARMIDPLPEPALAAFLQRRLDRACNIQEHFIPVRPLRDRLSVPGRGQQLAERRIMPVAGRRITGMTAAAPSSWRAMARVISSS